MFAKTVIILLLVYLSLDYSNGQTWNNMPIPDGYTYLEDTQALYKFHLSGETWFDAKQICAAEGGSLFFPENNEEAEAVVALWERTHPSYERFLLGMSELTTTGEFMTIDGKSVDDVYNKWKPGEPNHLDGNEHCVNWHKGGVINDCPCDYKDSFICKRGQWNYLCNMSNPDYTFNKDIGKCYKLHTTPLSWSNAYGVCTIEQSHLAVINSQMEADYLASLVASAPAPKVEGNYMRGIYHLGFHNKFNEGWRTIKDTPIQEELWWGDYEPVGKNQCGAMFFNGRLNNINCETRSLFICEHEVDPSSIAKMFEAFEQSV
uniref:C-type lectin domain-containing protein n=1 Tax=Heliothis virescens TaxID=7102 RepID=A0A2A4JYM8_HELVI